MLVVGVELRGRRRVPGDGLDFNGLLHGHGHGRRARDLGREFHRVLSITIISHLTDDGRRRLPHALGIRPVPATLITERRVLREGQHSKLGLGLVVDARVAPGVLGHDREGGHLARRASYQTLAVRRGPRRLGTVRLNHQRERRARDGLLGDALY